MKLFGYNLGVSNPFTDEPLGVHWEERGHNFVLWDDGYRVGQISKQFDYYQVDPFWNEETQEFKMEEEARAWLIAMYKMGGSAYVNKSKRRPAAK